MKEWIMYGNVSKDTRKTEQIIAETFKWKNSTGVSTPVKSSRVGNIVFLAVRLQPPKKPESIMAFIVPISLKNQTLTYTVISENDNPPYYSCPKKVFEALTPTENPQALLWREKCEAYQQDKELYKLPGGTHILVANQIICEVYSENNRTFFKVDEESRIKGSDILRFGYIILANNPQDITLIPIKPLRN